PTKSKAQTAAPTSADTQSTPFMNVVMVWMSSGDGGAILGFSRCCRSKLALIIADVIRLIQNGSVRVQRAETAYQPATAYGMGRAHDVRCRARRRGSYGAA